MDCLTPRLEEVPKGEWFCPACSLRNRSSYSNVQKQEKEYVINNIRHQKKTQFLEIAHQIGKNFENLFNSMKLSKMIKDEKF